MDKLVIFGNGPVARVTYHEIKSNAPYDIVAFTVDREFCNSKYLFEKPVVPFDEVQMLYPADEFKMIVSVGYVEMNKIREQRYSEAKKKGYQMISYVSPRAITWDGLRIGENCFIGPNSFIDSSAVIGDNVFIGVCCVIPHDCVIGDHCFLADGVLLGGSVVIDPYCLLGTGAIVRNKLKIARESVIGAGAVVLEDTEEKRIYVGKPADRISILSDKIKIQ